VISDWTNLKRRVRRKKVLENGTQAVISQFGKRNVVRMSAAVSFGGTLRENQKTAVRGATTTSVSFASLALSKGHLGILRIPLDAIKVNLSQSLCQGCL